MDQIWQEDKAVPVTIIKAEPNTVVLMREKDKDGYRAAQLAMSISKRKSFKKEFKLEEDEGSEIKAGITVTVADFAEGDRISLSAKSKGKGFQGVVKRHGFAGASKTHGTKDQVRASGSVGAAGVGRVFKGTRMGGRMGNNRVTIKRTVIVGVNVEDNTIMIKGAVPGARNTIVEIKKIGEAKK